MRDVHREIAARSVEGRDGDAGERLFSGDALVLSSTTRDGVLPQPIIGCELSTSRVSNVEKVLSPSLSARTQATSMYFFSPDATLRTTQRADILSSIFSPFMFCVVQTASSGVAVQADP